MAYLEPLPGSYAEGAIVSNMCQGDAEDEALDGVPPTRFDYEDDMMLRWQPSKRARLEREISPVWTGSSEIESYANICTASIRRYSE